MACASSPGRCRIVCGYLTAGAGASPVEPIAACSARQGILRYQYNQSGRRQEDRMTHSVSSDPQSLAGEELLSWFVTHLRAEIDRRGYRLIGKDEQTDEGGIVLYPVGPSGPRSFRRKNRAVFVVGHRRRRDLPRGAAQDRLPDAAAHARQPVHHDLREGQAWAARRPTSSRSSRASTRFPTRAIRTPSSRQVVDRLVPLATSQLIIENDFVTDLPEELWNGDEITESITRAGSTSTISICCHRPSRSRTTSRRRTSATSRTSSRWAASPTATSAPARTPLASG